MVKKVIYNQKDKTFSVISSLSYNKLKLWESEFIRITKESQISGLYIEVPLGLSKTEAIVPKIGFFERGLLQVYLLYQLKYDDRNIAGLVGANSKQFDELKSKVNQIYGSTIDIINKLRKDPTPPGYERLDRTFIDGKNAYSVESFDSHRIVYLPKSPYFIKITSILFHYKDEPREFLDQVLLDYYNYLTEYTPTQKQLQNILNKFKIDLNKKFK